MIHLRFPEKELVKLLHPMPKHEAIARIFAVLHDEGMDTEEPRAIQFARSGNDALFVGQPRER